MTSVARMGDNDGPEIRTTELGKRLFQDRLAAMRRINPDIKEPRWVIIDDPETTPKVD